MVFQFFKGTGDPKKCPAGKYSSQTGLEREDQCTLCDYGEYCETPGLNATTGRNAKRTRSVGGQGRYTSYQYLVYDLCRLRHNHIILSIFLFDFCLFLIEQL